MTSEGTITSTSWSDYPTPDAMQKYLTLLLQMAAVLVWTIPDAATDKPVTAEVVLFHIAKSNNRNRVEYAARVQPDCRFDHEQPLTVYWRRLEKGPDVTRPLKWVEEKFAYGIDLRHQSDERLEFTIAADDTRPVTVTTTRNDDGQCQVRAWLNSLEAPGVTDHAFVKLKSRKLMFPKIYWVDLYTTRPDGARICERVTERGEPGEPCPSPALRAPPLTSD
ncbi:MAG: DUF4833 domain-containing protein [Candidatus Dadabacteria bacterium]|nr:MAG: DUF4833 domain-containing protein [Candidatus Dadabacteria bacterium]